MKHVELARKTKSSSHWTRLAAVSLLAAAALAGCGGGSDGAPGAAGTPGTPGADGKDLTATVSLATMSATDWADLTPVGTVTGVAINSPPVVSFKVVDGYSRPLVGLSTSQLRFSIAKLVPGTNGSPSKWVSYIVGDPTTGAPGRPGTENVAANLVDNKDGTYKYTFARDITGPLQTKMAEWFADTANAASAYKKADVMGADGKLLDYVPALTHRLAIQLSGTSNGGTLKNPINVIYDFIPATGAAVTATDAQREITSIVKCNECHSKLAFHGGGRVDTKFCVVCHTDQRKNGQTAVTSTSGAFPALTKTVSATGSVSYSPTTYVADGEVSGNFPTMVHKIHMGKELTKANYNYANVLFNEITYPQPVTNCVKCHDGSATAANKTTQGDNWKNVPSLVACSSCHDGIDFKTGAGTTLSGSTVGHIGGAKTDDKTCILCHDAATIPVYHVTVDKTGANGRGGYPLNTATDVPTVGYPSGQGPAIPLASQLNSPAGVYKINFEISKVTVAGAAGAKKATVVYRILKDGAPVTLNATGLLMNNVDGSPGVYVAYGLPQDGITVPVDWTNTTSASVKELRDGVKGTQTGPDGSGYYTATLNAIIPDAAKMVTGGVGIDYNGFVQLGLTAYPKGIRLREPKFAMKVADNYTARRTVVSADKCNSCHGQLGVGPSFHSGARNNGEGCAFCHTPNTSTGHTGSAYSYGGGWSVSSKNLVHSIHASKVRANAFTYEATATNPTGFAEVTYPGILNKCEQCHVPGSYDFSAAANNAALPNLLWTTEAKKDMTIPALTDPATIVGLSPWVGAAPGVAADFSINNLVTSPVTSSCFGCHDSKTAVAHMQLNGGTVYGSVSAVSNSTTGSRTISGFNFTKVETCSVCHGPGKVADIKTVHMN